LPEIHATRISFAAHSSSSTVNGGTLVVAAEAGLTNCVTAFEFKANGTMGISDAFGGTYFVSYESNRWYHITFDLDWSNRTVDFYVDDTLIEEDVPFRNETASAISGLYLYNQSEGVSGWDQIEFLDAYSSGLLASSPTALNFVNGVWTGEVTVHQPHLAAQLQVGDETGRSGLGDRFDVLASNDLSLDVVTSSNPLLVGDELGYTVQIFNPGPTTATAISLQSTWSGPISILAAGSASAACVNDDTSVTCDLSSLASGGRATISIVAAAADPGLLTNFSIISRSGVDPDLDNNSRVTVTDVIPATTISINDTSIVEGDTGTTNATLAIGISAISTFPVTVAYTTVAGSATAGSDFTAKNGSVVFMPGMTNGLIEIPIINDLIRESNETFRVILTSADNAFILKNQATATILDNDPPPNLSITDVTIIEPLSGAAEARFQLSLDRPTGFPVQVNFSTADGTAQGGPDYQATNGTITIVPGQSNAWLSVWINADAIFETNEFFYVNLALPVNAALTQAQGRALIIDPAAPPCLTIDDVQVVEGNLGQTTARFTLSLSSSNPQPVSVAYTTQDGSAAAPQDYSASQGVVIFPPGTITQNLTIQVNGNLLNELDEWFSVSLTSATNAWICKGQGIASIINDDPLPELRISDCLIPEGNLGLSTNFVQISLSAPSERWVSVDFATADGNAMAGIDYVAASGTINFPPGVTNTFLTVSVRGDTEIESDETFFVRLSRPTNAVLQISSSTIIIIDDDSAPGVLNHFGWSTVPSPQTSSAPFAVSLAARDAFGDIVSSFNGTARIMGRFTDPDIFVGSGVGSSAHPMSTFFRSGRSQVIYRSTELGPAHDFTSLALNVATAPGQSLNNWTIRMKHSLLQSYSAPAQVGMWEATGWTTVFQTNVTVGSNGWVVFPFNRTFSYNGSNNLLIDFSFNNSSFTFDGQCRSTATAQPRSLVFGTDGPVANPLAWPTTNAPTGILRSEIPNIRLATLSLPLAVQPNVAGPFSNGSWSGSLTVPVAGTNVFLWADDQNGHFGGSNPFALVAGSPAPRINAIADRVIDEGSLLTFTATASGPPAGQLTFTLLPGAPSGATISPAGLFQWRPTEAQGPGAYQIVIRVEDNRSPPRSDQTNFTVTVNEVNERPIFTGPSTRYVYSGTPISFTTAADPDLPAQNLSFSFGPGAPSGASLNSASGVFSWTPPSPGTYSLRIDVSDDDLPSLSSSRNYTINVLGSGSAAIIATIFRHDNSVEIAWPSRAGRTYRVQYKDTLDQAGWTTLPDVAASNGSASQIDATASGQQRFYRVVLLP